MPEFIVRAHSAPTDPVRFLGEQGRDAHVEYLAHIVIAGLFISKGHREDVTITLVLEHSHDYSRAITLSGDSLGSLEGLSESAILTVLAQALYESLDLKKDDSMVLSNGVGVSAASFERLVKSRLERGGVFLLDRKGGDIRDAELPADPVFLLTDHVPLPRNLHKSFIRQGASPVSLGPVMLQASQCLPIILNEIDRRG